MKQSSLISPETFFSEEPLFAHDGLLNAAGLTRNYELLKKEFAWLDALIELRRRETVQADIKVAPIDYKAPVEEQAQGPFAHVLNKYELTVAERVMLLLALEPHYRPLHIKDRHADPDDKDLRFVRFMSYYEDYFTHNFYPTLQSALFLCAGTDEEAWRKCEQEIIHRGKLLKEQVIVLRDPDDKARLAIRLNYLVDLSPEYVDYLLHGRKPRPDFGHAFPAKWVTTNLDWDQLILNRLTLDQISDIMDWVEHGRATLSRSGETINRSFPCLFCGPPGTGKSFTAKLIGKKFRRDVFRIDLSMIVSKYIGETEKNLARLFDRAEGKDWILFFDEADSLFGKRTSISDAKDKWANLEMSYLLQRIEEYEGLCIMASNLKHNLDEALTRRFQAIIHFPFPKHEERVQIWEKSLPPGFSYAENISFDKLARFEFSGAGISNVIKSCCVKAVKRGDFTLNSQDISRFVRIEFAKENRTV